MAKRQSKTTLPRGTGRKASGNQSAWPKIRGGKNQGRSVNGGSRGGKRGEATSAFPTVEWPIGHLR